MLHAPRKLENRVSSDRCYAHTVSDSYQIDADIKDRTKCKASFMPSELKRLISFDATSTSSMPSFKIYANNTAVSNSLTIPTATQPTKSRLQKTANHLLFPRMKPIVSPFPLDRFRPLARLTFASKELS